jgi:hypothetical protein
MSRRGSLVLFIALVLTESGARAQLRFEPEIHVFVSADQLKEAVGGDAAAAEIVSGAIRRFFTIWPDSPTTVIASQIPQHWLPTIDGVQFVRLLDHDTISHFTVCGRLLWIKDLPRLEANVATMMIARGNKCRSDGAGFRFENSGDGWHEIYGQGTVFGTARGECECK